MRTGLNEALDEVNADGDQLADFAGRARSVAEALAAERIERTAAGLAERAGNRTFQLIFGGEFNSGKSTAINTVLGQRAMPTKEVEASAIPTYIRYGSAARALLYPRTGGAPVEVPAAEFPAHICVDPDDPDKDSPWDYAALYLTLELLDQGVVIVDPPGTNSQDKRTERNLEAIRESDAVVYLFFAQMGMTAAQRDAIANDLAGKECFWLVTHADTLRGGPDAAQSVRRRLERDLRKVRPGDENVDARIYFVDAHAAQEAKIQQDHDAFAASGMQDFEQALGEFISGDRHRAKMTAMCASLGKVIADLNGSIADQEKQAIDQRHGKQDEYSTALQEIGSIKARVTGAGERLTLLAQRLIEDAPDSVQAKVKSLPADPGKISYGNPSGKPTYVKDDTENTEIREEINSNLAGNSRQFIARWFEDEIASKINTQMAAETETFNQEILAAKTALTDLQRRMNLPFDQQGTVTKMRGRKLDSISDTVRRGIGRVKNPRVRSWMLFKRLDSFRSSYDLTWEDAGEEARDAYFGRVRAMGLNLIADEAGEISSDVRRQMEVWRDAIEESASLVMEKPLLDLDAAEDGVRDLAKTAEEEGKRRLQELADLKDELAKLLAGLSVVEAGYTTR